jgi:hypothetical protein
MRRKAGAYSQHVKGVSMSLKFRGGLARLKSAIACDEDLGGYWQQRRNGSYQYCTGYGGILNYFWKTGAITFQGDPVEKEKLKQAVRRAVIGV